MKEEIKKSGKGYAMSEDLTTVNSARAKLKELFEKNKSALDELFFNLIQDAADGTDKELLGFIEDYQETTLQYYGWVLIDVKELSKNVPVLPQDENLQ